MTDETQNRATVLIVDDDPSHLKLYSWIVGRGGFRTATALVGSTSVAFPNEASVRAVLLDYRLASVLTAPEIALLIKDRYPEATIIVLSDLPWMPDDMAAHAAAFVSKGEPEELLKTLNGLVPRTAIQS